MKRNARLVCAGVGTICGMTLAAILLWPSLLDAPSPPEDVPALAAWVAEHPADWQSARALSERALDSDVPQRIELWKAAYEHAQRLAPLRTQAQTAFVRGGLFHWQELSPADRQAVLAAAAPLLRDPATFTQLHRSLWTLTRDFGYLRNAAPDTPAALGQLRDLALAYGRFDDYRDLRNQVRNRTLEVVQSTASTAAVPTLLALVPRSADRADAPVLGAILDAVGHHPLDLRPDGHIISLLTATLDLGIEPPDRFAALLDATWIDAALRARLALALGNEQAATRLELASGGPTVPGWNAYFSERARHEAQQGDREGAARALKLATFKQGEPASSALTAEIYGMLGDETQAASFAKRVADAAGPEAWAGLCGTDICGSATSFDVFGNTPRTLQLEAVQTDEIPPYVEIFVDDALVAEGAIETRRSFILAAEPGIRELEVRLVNPKTRSGIQRRIRLSRSSGATAAPRMTASVAGFAGMKKLKSTSA